MTGDVLARTAAVVHDVAGFRLDQSTLARIRRCLRESARAHGLDEADLARRLPSDAALLDDLLDRVTVQESWWFRDEAHIEAAIQLLRDGRAAGPVWSIGCAFGQEPFSLAIACDEAGLAPPILATDLSAAAIERARHAVYRTRELRGLSDARRHRHLLPAGAGAWVVDDAIRRRVIFQQHNVLQDEPPLPPDRAAIVFCRNVLIYLGDEEVARLAESLATVLAPGSWLFLGPSETLWPVTKAFRSTKVGDAFVHVRVDETAEAVTPDPPRAAPRQPARPRVDRPTRRRAPLPPARRAGTAPSPPLGALGGLDAALDEGRRAMASGDITTAIAGFRRATFIDPDDPVAHTELALALDAAGDAVASRRSFAAARAALGRSSGDVEGYESSALERLIADRLQGSP